MSAELLGNRLFEEQKEATKLKDRFRLSVIRMLRSELQNAAIAKKEQLDSQEELAVLSREVKRRQDALVEFKKSGRQDLVDNLQHEIELLKKYLPEQLSEEDLKEMVRSAVSESGAATKQDMGKVMSLLMPRVKGRTDGAVVRKMVEDMLQ